MTDIIDNFEKLQKAYEDALTEPELELKRAKFALIEFLSIHSMAILTEIKRQRHRATNAEYMAEAYRNMLGPNGLAVAKRWDERGTKRVHFDWGPDAFSKLDGEGRAKFILEIPDGRRVENIDG